MATLAAAACDPSGPTAVATAPVAEAAVPILHSVRGSGQITTSAKRHLTFEAIQLEDGSVRGSFQYQFNGNGNSRVFVEVTCMRVIGNRAWLGGVVKHSNNPAQIGLESATAVEDNGEGGSDAPDEISLAFVPNATPGLAQAQCDNPTLNPSLPLDGGNVQVR